MADFGGSPLEKSSANSAPASTSASSSTSLPPLNYVVEKMNELADYFWDNAETSDCTVIIPLPIAPLSHRRPVQAHAQNPFLKQNRSQSKPFQDSAEHSDLYERRIQARPDQNWIKAPVNNSPNDDHRESVISASTISSPLPSASTSTSTSSLFTLASSHPPSSAKGIADLDFGPTFSRDVNNPIMMESDLRTGSAPVNNASRGESSYWQGSNHSRGLKQGSSLEEDLGDDDSAFKRTTRSEASSGSMRRLTFKLHRDYLISQSTLFRKILSSKSPLDLSCEEGLNPTSPSDRDVNDKIKTNPSFPNLPQPLLLTSTSHSHPVIFLPLPDPYSFGELIRFLYFGDFDLLAKAMRNESVKWEGIVANTQLLGLNSDVKKFLGLWYKENANLITHDRKVREVERAEKLERSEREIDSLSQRYDSTLNLEKDDHILSFQNGNHQVRKEMSVLDNRYEYQTSFNQNPINNTTSSSCPVSTSTTNPFNATATSPSSIESQNSLIGDGDGDSDTTMRSPANKIRRNSEFQKDVSVGASSSPEVLHSNLHSRPDQVPNSFHSSPNQRRFRRPTSASNPRPFNPNPTLLPKSSLNFNSTPSSSFQAQMSPPSSFSMGTSFPSMSTRALPGFGDVARGGVRKRGRRPHSRA